MKKPEGKKNNNQETLKVSSFAVTRVKCFDNGSIVFDMILNGISIYGCNVVEGKNGDFISFPSRKGSDDKYYSIVWARLSEEDQKAILDAVEVTLNQ